MGKRSYKARTQIIENPIKNEQTPTTNNWWLDKYK
jgi:hypothetical protein